MGNQPSGKAPRNCSKSPKSPYWQYDFQYKGFRDRGSTDCRTAHEAGKWADDRRATFRTLINARLSGDAPTAAKVKIAVVAACERWADDKHPQTEAEKTNPMLKSWKTEETQLATLAGLLGSQKRLCDVNAADLVAYRLTRSRHPNFRGATMSGASINREIELLRRVWRHASDIGFDCGQEPAWGKFLDRGAEAVRCTELLPEDEVKLMEALSKRNPALALIAEFAMLCGQRKAQVCLLKRRNVNISGKRATIYLKRKGTALAPHTFPLTERMIEILGRFPQLASTEQWFTYVCRRNSPPRQDRPGRIAGQRYPFTKQGWQRDWRRAVDEAGLVDFRFHDLRHTTATRVVRKVRNLKIAQRLLGHSNIATTARYAHATDEDVLAALNAVAK